MERNEIEVVERVSNKNEENVSLLNNNNVLELINEAGDVLSSSNHDKKIQVETLSNNNKESSTKLKKYMSERMMSPLQEKFNAWTILPNVFYCMYFLTSGKWLSEESIDLAQFDMMGDYVHMQDGDFRANNNESTLLDMFSLDGKCISNSYFPNMYALPPLPLLAIALGITLHAPWSFLYHYNCATILPPDTSRIEHWSRRMDHSMIHIASALLSYGTSGRLEYFLINAVYNLDCVHRQFQPIINPKLNKIRILVSILSYTIPILIPNGNYAAFIQCWCIIIIGAWLFAAYPIRGWSHSAFHIVMSALPHLLLVFACSLPASQDSIHIAAKCAVIHSSR